MTRTLAALAVLTLGPALTTSVAHAQTPPVSGSPVNRATPLSTHTYWPSYSYWTAAYYGYPPRIYIGLGSAANDFPYYGQPYGSPSDPWTWPAMAGNGSGRPTRYYNVLP
jgi:hypothetical protein